MMTVAQVTHYMPPHLGGIERLADTLFDAYRAGGLCVEWIASHVPSHAPRRESGKLRVGCLNVLETWLDVPVPLWGPSAARELAAAVRRADVVHVHDCLYPGSALTVWLARRYGRPTLLTQHIGFVTYRARLLNVLERLAYATLGRRLLRQVSHVALATPGAEAHVRQLLGAIPRNSSVIPYGIDLERFRPPTLDVRRHARASLGLEHDVPAVLYAGRLVEKKGLPLVLDVAARLPQARVLVVGDGRLAPLMARAPSNVMWARSVAFAEMTRYYHAADCLLMPSIGEGLPLVVEEALACGLTAVVSAEEPFATGLAGAGVAVAADRNADALAVGVRAACESHRAGMGERGRRYAEQHWDVRVMASRYIELLHMLVAAQRNESGGGGEGRQIRPSPNS